MSAKASNPLAQPVWATILSFQNRGLECHRLALFSPDPKVWVYTI